MTEHGPPLPPAAPRPSRRRRPAAAPLFPLVTWSVGVLLVVVFGTMSVRGVSVTDSTVSELLAWGASHGPRTMGGEPWRLLTATFLHSDLLHLVANLCCLLLGGIVLERILGHGRFLVLFLVSALAASGTSIAVHPEVVSLGASGAVFGIFGGLLALLRPRRGSAGHPAMRGLGRAVLVLVTAQLAYGLWAPDVDNGAHLGGWLAGFLLVHGAGLPRVVTAKDGRRRRLELPRWGRSLAGAGLVTCLVLVGAWWRAERDGSPDALRLWEQAESLRLEQQWQEAERCYDQLAGFPRADPMVLLGRGICRLELGRYDEAATDLLQATRQLPQDPFAWFHLGMVRARTGRYEDAAQALSRCLRLEDSAEAFLVRGWVREQLGLLVEARRDYSLAQEFDPSSPDPWYEEALLLCTWTAARPPEAEQAERLARRALELDPEDPDHWALLALVHLRRFEPDAAAVALQEARRHGATDSLFQRLLSALVLHSLGQERDAAQEWMAIGPASEAGLDRAMEALLFEAQVLFPRPPVIR